jgi:polysaccharide biosynthesis/export protein
MKSIGIAFLSILIAGSVSAQQQLNTAHNAAGAASLTGLANLPVERIGKNDLIGITVYDCPELTRAVRADSNAEIRLPMLRHAIHAGGLYPSDLEHAITAALIEDKVLVDPVVSVSIVEYRSRPISVVGAVKNTMTFQATGVMTLLEAISQAGGLTENAGSEILVSRQQSGEDGESSPAVVQRIPVHGLFDSADSSLNFELQGGEVISIPEAGRVYVVGRVKKPGVFSITDEAESSVLRALALSGGLDSFFKPIAYIYRLEDGHSQRTEIPIELKKIMNRRAPDIPLLASDILYIPDAAGLRASLTVLDRAILVGSGLGATLLYASH